MIRWSYLGPRLVVLALLWAAAAFALDPLLRRGVERAGSAAVGARVNVSGLSTKIFPPSLRLWGVAVADPEEPMRNLFEFRAASFAFEGRPLLEKKLVVGAAALEGLTLGTPRTASGALPRAKPSPAAAALSKWAGEAKNAFGAAGAGAEADLAATYKVDPEGLASVKLARELEARWPKALAEWQGKAQAFDAGCKESRRPEDGRGNDGRHDPGRSGKKRFRRDDGYGGTARARVGTGIRRRSAGRGNPPRRLRETG